MKDEIDNVLTAIGTDSRIGNKYLKFGFGFGGPCFPRDNRAFAAYAKDLGVCFNLGETIDNFNIKHSDFIFKYYVSKNINKLPFCFHQNQLASKMFLLFFVFCFVESLLPSF